MAATSVHVQAVVDWLTLAPLLPPTSQTLADVRCRACLHTLGLMVHTHRLELEDRVKMDYPIPMDHTQQGYNSVRG